MLQQRPRHRNLHPLLLLAALAIIFTIWQHLAWAHNRASLPEYLCQKLGYPIMSAISTTNEIIHDGMLSILYAHSLAAQNRQLRQQRDRLLAEKMLLTEYFRENKAFREKLGFQPHQEVKKIPAEVIGRTSAPQRCHITIRIASGREVHQGDIVREAAGLVGQVIEEPGRIAQVLLIIDAEHGLGARNQRSRDVGIVKPIQQWTAGWPNRLQMKMLTRRADIRTGDVIITSGEDGIYPASIPVGVVEAVTASPTYAQTTIAIIRPFVDFQRLQYVWVVPRP